jgi:serine/threonine-protein kinase
VPDDRWSRVKALFFESMDLDANGRDRYLAEHCAGDPVLDEEVRSLLRAHDEAAVSAERLTAVVASIAGARSTAPPTSAAGRIVGSYRLEREVGHGGMGTVYLATRADGTFDKQVALKIVPRGLDTGEILQRFRHERQTLAGLDHPNIARLLDGGTTDDGLPYFVMEYVDGVPIDTYCDERALGVRERLQLFCTVCAAVASAHRNLVVHRDLKPDNILVSADGVPKLVDFGIAKVLAAGAARSPLTVAAERVMTPEYASPEQILGLPITTATDVYSLGVLLYELLTGRRPFPRRPPFDGPIGREVLEHSPGRPSSVVLAPAERFAGDDTPASSPQSISAARRTSPSALSRRLAGDLDTIVLMAIRKEPERRYGSAEQLAEDVRRHLEGLPVIARRDAVGYRAAKFVARHAAGVAAGALILALVAVGVVGIAWQARVAALERDRARVEAEKAGQINAFLEDMLRAPDPQNSGRTVTVVDTLDRAARRLDAEKATRPEVRASIRRALGVTYAGLGMYDAAESQLRRALEGMRSDSIADRAEIAAAETDLANVISSQGDLPGAERLYRRALASFEGLNIRDDLRRAETLNGLGETLRGLGNDEAAESRYRDALAIRRRLLPETDVAIAESLNNLAVVMQGRNNLAEAERLYRESLGIVRAARGDDHPGVPATLSNLATVISTRGDLAGAVGLYQEALAIRRRLLGDDHPDVMFTIYSYADTLHALRRYGEAIALARDVLARRGGSLPAQHPLVAASLLVMGKSLLEQGHGQAAEAALREAVAIRQTILPPGHWLTASAEGALGRCLVKQSRFRQAEPLLVGAYERLHADRGARHERTLEALKNVIELYEAWHNPGKVAAYRARLTS